MSFMWFDKHRARIKYGIYFFSSVSQRKFACYLNLRKDKHSFFDLNLWECVTILCLKCQSNWCILTCVTWLLSKCVYLCKIFLVLSKCIYMVLYCDMRPQASQSGCIFLYFDRFSFMFSKCMTFGAKNSHRDLHVRMVLPGDLAVLEVCSFLIFYIMNIF